MIHQRMSRACTGESVFCSTQGSRSTHAEDAQGIKAGNC
jgi:putative hemolysin